MIALYHYPFSQHARRVVSLLEEAELKYELKHVAMDKSEFLSPEYTAINPNQQVPTFHDGNIIIHESNAILRYLCFKHHLNTWYPLELPQRALVEQWLDWNQCRLSGCVTDIVLNKVFLGDQGDPSAIKRGEENLQQLMDILSTGLEGHSFLAGNQATIADLSVASNIFQLGIAKAVPKNQNILDWYQRVNLIKGFAKSLPEHSLT